MSPPTILLVEDNPLTRGVLEEMLRSGGYDVVPAPDGRTALAALDRARPALVLQDMALPDMDGLELLTRLRAKAGPGLPIVALSGLPVELQRAQDEEGVRPGEGFTDYLTKPVTAAALLLAIQAYVTAGDAGTATPGGGRCRVLVVEAPADLDSLGLALGQAGFEPTLCADGDEALADARRLPPAAVVAGALLPGLDGFRLCHAMRTDPALKAVPVVLVSRTFAEEEDRCWARRLGASALVSPGPGSRGVAEAVRAALAQEPPAATADERDLGPRHAERVMAALAREAEGRAALERRVRFQSAALSLIGVMSESLSRAEESRRAPDEILARCLSAAGTSQGAAYLRGPDGRLALAAQVGFGERDAGGLQTFFGHGDLVLGVIEGGEPVVLPSDAVARPVTEDLLVKIRCRSVLLTPVVLGPEGTGVLVMMSGRFDLVDWVDLSRAVSSEIRQTLALARAVSHVAASEGRYRHLFESAIHGIYRTGRDGRIRESNPALAAILRRPSAAALAGTEPPTLCGEPAERAFLAEKHRGSARFEGVEVRWTRADGTAASVRLSGQPVVGDDGGQDGFEVFVEDVTARHEAEERTRGGDQSETLRRIAAGAAHDLNDLLTAVSGHADRMARGLDASPDLREHALAIQGFVERGGGVARELLALSRLRTGAPRPVDLEEAVAAALPMVRRILGHGFEVAVHRGPPAGRVFADPGGVLQALAAAASRARAAMREGGAVTVETARVILDEEFARRNPGVLPGTYAMLAVRDGGPPLGEEECRRVLEPSAEGSETSLAPVAEFARRSGGHVLVRPDRARGNTVRVYLPRYEGAAGLATAAAAAGEAPAAPSGGRTVLLAEDEEAVRTLIAETLRMEGHEVVEARDGAEALRVAAGVAGPIHLLLTDLQMPGMTGPDLAGRLLAERPGMRVLFVTGYFERPEGGSMDLPAGAPVLLKPFTPAALAEKVRETLGTASPGAAT